MKTIDSCSEPLTAATAMTSTIGEGADGGLASSADKTRQDKTYYILHIPYSILQLNGRTMRLNRPCKWKYACKTSTNKRTNTQTNQQDKPSSKHIGGGIECVHQRKCATRHRRIDA